MSTPRSSAGCWRCCATARQRATRSTRRAWCGWPSTAATACARCAPRPASPTTSACRARCSCSGPRSSSTAAPATSPCCVDSGVAFELLDRAGCIRHEPALARVEDKFVGGLLLPGDETGDCFKFTQRLAELAAARGVAFRFDTRCERARSRGKRIGGVVTAAGETLDGRRVPGRARQLLAAAAQADRRSHPRLSGQGLLDHRADRRCRRRTRIDGDGRDPQGRGHAARRPHPRRRHGRARRLHVEAARGAPEYARSRRQRPVPQRRRRRRGRSSGAACGR